MDAIAGDLRAVLAAASQDPPRSLRGSLLEACRSGDAGGWRRLFGTYSGQVYKWSALLGLSPSEAEEAGQEVFATAARRIETCKCDEAISSWLFQITRRVVANTRRGAWWRRIWRGPELPDDEPAFEHESAQDLELEVAVRSCLKRLRREHAEVLVVMELEGRTREEAAQLLDLPPGTVASRLRVAREAFREEWSALAARAPAQRGGR